jgi:hypothetical protein
LFLFVSDLSEYKEEEEVTCDASKLNKA